MKWKQMRKKKRILMSGTMTTPKKSPSDVDKAFSEGSTALYLVVQMICPECNKLVRISLLTNEMTKVKP